MEQDKAGGMLGATGSPPRRRPALVVRRDQGGRRGTATMVKRRRLPDSRHGQGRRRRQFRLPPALRHGALATIHVCATAPIDAGEEIILSGSGGLLMSRATRPSTAPAGARSGCASCRSRSASKPNSPSSPTTSPARRRSSCGTGSARSARAMGRPAPSFADGAKIQEIMDGVIRSRAQGRWIDTSGTRWPLVGDLITVEDRSVSKR